MFNIILVLILGISGFSTAFASDPCDDPLKLLGNLQTHGQELRSRTEALNVLLAPFAATVSSPLAVLLKSADSIVNRAKIGLNAPNDSAVVQYALTMIVVDVSVGRSALTRLNVELLDKPISPEAHVEIEKIQGLLETMNAAVGGANLFRETRL